VIAAEAKSSLLISSGRGKKGPFKRAQREVLKSARKRLLEGAGAGDAQDPKAGFCTREGL